MDAEANPTLKTVRLNKRSRTSHILRAPQSKNICCLSFETTTGMHLLFVSVPPSLNSGPITTSISTHFNCIVTFLPIPVHQKTEMIANGLNIQNRPCRRL